MLWRLLSIAFKQQRLAAAWWRELQLAALTSCATAVCTAGRRGPARGPGGGVSSSLLPWAACPVHPDTLPS